jgi:hypothetical protein
LAASRIVILGNGAFSLDASMIAGSALRYGLLLEVVEGDDGNAVQKATDPPSRLRSTGLDFALVACDPRLLGLDEAALSREGAEGKMESAFARKSRIVERRRHRSSQGRAAEVLPLVKSPS